MGIFHLAGLVKWLSHDTSNVKLTVRFCYPALLIGALVLTREILVETARDLLISFLKNPKNDSENPFDWNMSHGGFSVEVLEVDENNEITAASLSWSPLSGEGWLNIPTQG